MKYSFYFFFAFCLISCQNKSNVEESTSENVDETPALIQKGDLLKMNWIVGDWKSELNGIPFYEVYHMVNDSTLLVLSYVNLGTDSSSVVSNYLYWRKDAYYLGVALNYKVVELNEKEVKMVPHGQASNHILWTNVNPNTWTALLTSASDTLLYTMQKATESDSLFKAMKHNNTPAR